jgi:hypothetical protein
MYAREPKFILKNRKNATFLEVVSR